MTGRLDQPGANGFTCALAPACTSVASVVPAACPIGRRLCLAGAADSRCKAVGLSRGAAPDPRPPSERGGLRSRVISSPGQAEPYPGTPGTARARCARSFGQTLAVPENPW